MLELIKELSLAFGAPGFEDDVVEMIKLDLPHYSHERDSMNNLFLGMSRIVPEKPVVAIDCHSDEVGFIVEGINKNGSISFLTLGGWFLANLPSQLVTIKNSRGDYITGLISSKPPHFMSEDEKKQLPKIESLTIDVGSTSYEETTKIFGIAVGDPIVPKSEFNYDDEVGILRGKAFDNRIGCVCMVEVMKAIKDRELNVVPVGVVSAQEEVGLRGAQVAAQRVEPDFAIVFEGAPADDTFKDAFNSKGALKKGVQLRIVDGAMISNPRVLNYAKKIAEANQIPYQVIAREKGSTNGAKYHTTNNGIPTLVLGIPTRYIHTANSYAALSDVRCAIELALKIVEDLTEEKISQF